MGRSLRLWWLALGVSLLLHGSLIVGLGWRLPQWDLPPEPPSFDAQLVSAPPSAEIASPPVRTPPAANKPAPPLAPLPAALPPPEPLVESGTEAAAPAVIADDGLTDAEVARVEQAPATQPVPAEHALPSLNPLPPRLDLRFQVRYGLASGEQTLIWVVDDERYTVTSVAAASGLASVFYRGRLVQTSRGRITPRGLQPEEFWDQRGDKRSSARFDAANRDLTVNPAKGAARHFDYQGDVQDVLSLFFQLALTAPPQDRQLTYTVFNGKKLRDYVYEVRGEETLETALGALRTLHLARVADADGRFEAWLAIDRHYLPVRMIRSDDKGNEMELRVQSIAP